MKKSAYGKPILLDQNDQIVELERVEAIDELSIQQLIYEHPDCLPISEIDESFNPVVPVCMELGTPVGPLDILMVTPDGGLIIVETKLWRNPGARRVVVAQILDYAKELANWSYEDLQREINKKLLRRDNTLYELVKEKYEHLVASEADFVDSVSRNLSRGRFLLLIAGDGIREGALGIAEYLSSAAHLNFSFAMVELNIFEGEGIGRLVIPKTIAKTVELPKLYVEIPAGLTISNEEEFSTVQDSPTKTLSPEKEREKQFYIKFWIEFVKELSFDDPGQPLPNPGKAQNTYVYPGKSKKAWISAYFAKSNQRVGVYFRTQNDQEGHEISDFLDEYKDDIRAELGDDVVWEWEQSNSVAVRFPCEDIFASENREDIKAFFQEWLNKFVNVFRPRLKRM